MISIIVTIVITNIIITNNITIIITNIIITVGYTGFWSVGGAWESCSASSLETTALRPNAAHCRSSNNGDAFDNCGWFGSVLCVCSNLTV